MRTLLFLTLVIGFVLGLLAKWRLGGGGDESKGEQGA